MKSGLTLLIFMTVMAQISVAQTSSAENPQQKALTKVDFSKTPGPANRDAEVASDLKGYDIEPYLKKVTKKIRKKWDANVREAARRALLKQGSGVFRFTIERDGSVSGVRVEQSSGDASFDQAAWLALTQASPLKKLPAKLQAPYVVARIRFDQTSRGSSVSAWTAPAPDTGRGRSGDVEIITDTKGVNLAPYLGKAIEEIRINWYQLIPESARAPQLKKGETTIEFTISGYGTVKGMKLFEAAGDNGMDSAAWKAISNTKFDPLPDALKDTGVGLRIKFRYNPEKKRPS